MGINLAVVAIVAILIKIKISV